MLGLPLIEQIKLPADAPAFYEAFADQPYSFLLDSSLVVEGLGRYSFLGADPFLIFRSKGHFLELISKQGKGYSVGHPLLKLKELLNTYKLDLSDFPFPFCGGAVGYFSYDLGRMLEKLPVWAIDDLFLPDLCLGFYDVVILVDQISKEGYIISTGLPETVYKRAYHRARGRLQEMRNILLQHICYPRERRGGEYIQRELLGNAFQGCEKFIENGIKNSGLFCQFNKESFCQVVRRAKEYIRAGDIYQVNLAQRFSLPLAAEPWLLYQRLRLINPAPMAAYLDFGDVQVVSASPERFLKVNGRQVETRPIKGTRPRGKNAREDLRLLNELWNSEKDKAELVMIIDLERNDLGRLCRTGSVRVPELFRLEEYPTVFHLVSTVTGELPPDRSVVDLIEVTFPGGSITGAPKIRAMEIIEELEPARRGVYTGSLGYLSFHGDADLSIVIRTMLIKDGCVHFQAGGGITADSDPLAEYQETLDKALALMLALGLDVNFRNQTFFHIT